MHRLTAAVPEEQLAAVGETVRAAIATGAAGEQSLGEPRRSFASAGTLSAEHDLAERAEEILRTEPDTAAPTPNWHSSPTCALGATPSPSRSRSTPTVLPNS